MYVSWSKSYLKMSNFDFCGLARERSLVFGCRLGIGKGGYLQVQERLTFCGFQARQLCTDATVSRQVQSDKVTYDGCSLPFETR